MQSRAPVYAAILAAILAGVGYAVYERWNAPPTLDSGTTLPEPRRIGDFSLVDQHGRPFGRDALEDRWSLVFTGFTHCPDLCPTTLALLASVRSRVPGEGLQFVFVSVDPERDTPERIANYLAHFDARLVGATGTRMEIERFTKSLGLAQMRNPGVGGDYTVDHSAALVLIDPRARVTGYFQPPHDADALIADLSPLIKGDAPL